MESCSLQTAARLASPVAQKLISGQTRKVSYAEFVIVKT